MDKMPARVTSTSSSEATIDRDEPSSSHATSSPLPFSAQFFDKSPQAAAARAIYLKTIFGGVMAICIAIFAVFPIYWGSLWSTPHHPLPGWIVDFDGGAIGQTVSAALSNIRAGTNGVSWQVVSAGNFPRGISDLQTAIVQEKTWYAVAINAGASDDLFAAVSAANASHDSSLAITFMGSEARNENIFRIHSRIVSAELQAITHEFALQFTKNISSSANVATLLSTAPQLVTRPIYFTTENLRPFDVPVASAVTFVGLIYVLILAFFIVNVSAAAREASGLEKTLTLGSLIRIRLITSVAAYFFVSLFYTLLSRAFQLPFNRHFGSAGFVIFWMLNWIGMLACGLALDAVLPLLTVRFTPFFLILWIITNVSVSIFPLQVLPHVYRYGYAFPFYNISRAVRAIVFGTKNDLGVNFGILIAWVAVSCTSLPLIQWLVRRRAIAVQGRTKAI